jgi:4-aminobutyrate aminotransferase-like enzyme
MTAHGDLDRDRIHRLHTEELTRFRAERPGTIALQERARSHMPNGTPMAWMASDNDQPIYVDHGEGASFTDVDRFTYVDFNASDLAMFCGHAVPEIVRAERVAIHTNSCCRRRIRRGRESSHAGARTRRVAVHRCDAGEHAARSASRRRHRP